MAELLSLLSSIFSSLPSWTGAFIAGLALVGTIVYNAVNIHSLTIQIRGARQEEARREQEVAATLERLQTETKRLQK